MSAGGGKMTKRRERVTRVIDGDTFETASRTHPVRLANVDAPEKRQPGYQEAKRELQRVIRNEMVEVGTVARDQYGRAVAEVRVGGQSVNQKMRRAIGGKRR